MRISKPVAYAVSVVAAGALLAACSGMSSQSSGAAPSSMVPQHVSGTQLLARLTSTSLAVKAPAFHKHHSGKSWMSPDAARAPRLLFQSDSGTDEVYVLTLPGLSLKGTLTGFSEPQGECSNAKGNIWITNTGTEQLLEYSRTGTLLATLDDSTGYPVGCAVNSDNDLAVTNIFDFSGAGSVLVYKNSTGTPSSLSNPDQYYYYFDGYDSSGNLYTSGRDSSGTYILSECAEGASSCSTITISGGTVYFPGAVQWYTPGNYLSVSDQLCGDTEAACAYWVTISGSSGTITGTTDLSNYDGSDACDVVQSAIAANGQKYLAGGDYEYCGYTSSTSNRWAFDAGGKPSNYNDTAGQDVPIGAAVSTK